MTATELATPVEPRTKRRQSPSAGLSVTRITVERLFGRYDYELPAKDDVFDLSRLFILYGENGGGKTTLLQLIYHALSPANYEGHLSFLAQAPFDRFAIEFRNGFDFEAQRKIRKSGGGVLQLALHRDARTLANVEIALRPDGRITAVSSRHAEDYEAFLSQLRNLNVRVRYVPDDREGKRRALHDSSPSIGRYALAVARERQMANDDFGAPVPAQEDAPDSLESAVRDVVQSVRRQARKGSAAAQEDFYSLLARAVHKITTTTPEGSDPQDESRLVESLKVIRNRSEQFARYGLVVEFPADDLIGAIKNAPAGSRAVLYNVVKSQLDGIEARLNALSDLHENVDRLIETVNSFYRDKEVVFTVDDGLAIRSSDAPLKLAMLSSGERQLLLLFCRAFLARSHVGLFLIDEPEMSLNVEWQRRFVQGILGITEGSDVQFLLATHSIELISQYDRNVVALECRPQPRIFE